MPVGLAAVLGGSNDSTAASTVCIDRTYGSKDSSRAFRQAFTELLTYSCCEIGKRGTQPLASVFYGYGRAYSHTIASPLSPVLARAAALHTLIGRQQTRVLSKNQHVS